MNKIRIAVLLFIPLWVHCQCPTSGFSLTYPNAVCQSDSFVGEANFTSNYDSTTWYLNPVDSFFPVGSSVFFTGGGGVNIGTISLGQSLVFDGTNWYMFDAGEAQVRRFDLGSDITAPAPTVTLINSFAGSPFNAYYGIKFLQDAGNWYGLAASYAPNNQVIRYALGSSLTNPTPTRTNFLPTDVNLLDSIRHYEILTEHGGDIKFLLCSETKPYMTVAHFENGIENPPSFYQIPTPGIIVQRAVPLYVCGHWKLIGVVKSGNDTLLTTLNFSSTDTLGGGYSVAVLDTLQISSPTTDIVYLTNAGVNYVYVANGTNELFAYELANDLNSISAQLAYPVGLFSGAMTAISLSVAQSSDTSYLFSHGFSSPTVRRVIQMGLPSTQSQVTLAGNSVSYVPDFDTGFVHLNIQLHSQEGHFTTLKDSIRILPTTNIQLLGDNLGCANSPLSYAIVYGDSGLIAGQETDFGDGSGVSTSTESLHTFAAPGAYTIVATATQTNGCAISDSISATINPKPSAGFTFTPACANQPVAFTDTSTISSGSISTTQWSFPDGQVRINPGTVFDQVINAGGILPVELIAISDLGCRDTALVPIGIPGLDFDVSNLCAGQPAQFQAIANYPTDIVQDYTWDIAGQPQSGATPAPVNLPEGNAVVALVVQTQNGCTDTVIKTYSVVAPPSAGVRQLTDAACAGNLIDLEWSGTLNGGTLERVLWNWGTGLTGDTAVGTTASFLYTDPNTYSVEQTIFTVEGCAATASYALQIGALPEVTLPDAVVLCSRQAQTFSAEVTLSDTTVPSGYFWSYPTAGGTLFTTQPTPSIAWEAPDTLPLACTVTTTAGCTGSDTATVTVLPTPLAQFIAVFSDTAAPADLRLENLSIGADTAYYVVSTGQNLNAPLGQTVTTPVPIGGTYSVQLIAIDQASLCADTTAQSLALGTEVLPEFDVVVLETTATYNAPAEALSITAIVQNQGNLALDSLWLESIAGPVRLSDVIPLQPPLFPGAIRGIAVPTTFLFTAQSLPDAACLRVWATDSAEANDATPANNTACASLNGAPANYRVFPNPVTDQRFTIEAVVNGPGETIEVAAVNTLGQFVLPATRFTSTGTQVVIDVDAKAWANGLYYLGLTANGETRWYRLVIANQ